MSENTNSLKESLAHGDNPLGTWISVGHPAVAEVGAIVDLDFVLVDTEHTSTDLEAVENILRGVDARAGPTEAVIRVPWNDQVELKRFLDAGASNVMVPMINTVEEAERLVDAIRYPPEGSRGVAGGRASDYGLNFGTYVENANESILTIVQIETEQGVRNAADIAAVDGVDALFIGPADLSRSLGVFRELESDAFTDAVDRVIEAGRSAGVPVGTLTVPLEDIGSRVDQGFDFLIAGKDTAHLAAGHREAKQRYERALADDRAISNPED